MSSADSLPNGSNTSTVLLDQIRTLRDPLPSETFLDTSPVEPSFESSSGAAASSLSSQPKNTPALNGPATHTHNPVTDFRKPINTPRATRAGVFPKISSEELGLSPKERFQAYLSTSSSSSSSTTKMTSSKTSSPREMTRTSSDSAVITNSHASHTVTVPASKTMQPPLSPRTLSSPLTNGESASQQTNASMASILSGSASTQRTGSSSVTAPAAPSNSSPPKPSDATSLIATAGSAETAVFNLLKEKHTLTLRNDQLWKLIEKQRAMILNLNKDLEKIIKDRERYKKKLKEKENEAGSVQIPETSEVLANGTLEGRSFLNSSPARPADMQQHAETAQTRGHHKEPSIDTLLSIPHSDETDTAPKLSDNVTSPSTSVSTKANQPLGQNNLPLREIDISRANARGIDGSSYTPSSMFHKSPSLLYSPGEGKRKAPPTPLNLAKPKTPAAPPVVAEEDVIESGSDYDDASPPVERGRRKTREDDDRIREANWVEEQNRSKSGKDSTSKSKENKTAAPEVQKQVVTQQPASLPVAGLPTSPRAPLLGGLQSPLQPAQGSISSILMQSNRVPPAPSVPSNTTQTLETPLKSPGLPLKSPGLPMSPRPGDRPMNAPAPRLPMQQVVGPGPMSPRSAMVLSPRAPRQPIPLPQDMTSPATSRAENFPQHLQDQSLAPDRVIHGRNISRDENDPANLDQIYRGFTSDQYRGLLLPPNALSLVNVKVESARLRPSRIFYLTGKNGEDEAIFTLAVHSKSDNKQLWRLEKTPLALPVLDQSLRKIPEFSGKLPDRAIYSGHAPTKIDSRRAALAQYFTAVMETPLDDATSLALCDFLSTDLIGPERTNSSLSGEKRRKEGYLAKKGKQFGGWKSRYFILDGGELRYFEGPSGGHLGSVKLAKAQIAKQTTEETTEDAEFRHAFMILEPKRRDSSSLVRHVLCAESDEERDAWVDALMAYVELNDDLSSRPSLASDPGRAQRVGPNGHSSTPSISNEQTGSNGISQGHSGRSSETPSPEDNNSDFGMPSIQSAERPNISGPVAGGPIQNAQAWGNKSPALRDTEARKRNIFGFRSRNSEDNGPMSPPLNQQHHGSNHLHSLSESQSSFQPLYTGVNHSGRPIFGIPLGEAAKIFPPQGLDICLPSPVYRCIEFLEAKNAQDEEGIFRMSGSNTVIKQIKDRFNNEGDVRLLKGPSYDVHAIASLLKLYLRELPDSVLTRELHLDFLKVLDTDDKAQRIEAVNVLAHRLPEANFELLAALTRFLKTIVNNSDHNKMNVRNVGIVFSPTLNIPAPLFSLFLSDHESIFGHPIDANSSQVIASIDTPQSTPPSSHSSTLGPVDDFRSPRKQMFTDLATPAPNQTSFGANVHNDAFFQPMYSQQPPLRKSEPENSLSPVSPRSEPSSKAAPVSTSNHQYRGIPAPVARMPGPDPSMGGFSSLNAALAPSAPQQRPR